MTAIYKALQPYLVDFIQADGDKYPHRRGVFTPHVINRFSAWSPPGGAPLACASTIRRALIDLVAQGRVFGSWPMGRSGGRLLRTPRQHRAIGESVDFDAERHAALEAKADALKRLFARHGIRVDCTIWPVVSSFRLSITCSEQWAHRFTHCSSVSP